MREYAVTCDCGNKLYWPEGSRDGLQCFGCHCGKIYPRNCAAEPAPSPVEPARPRELGDGFQCYVNLTQSPTPEQWKQSYLDVTASHGQALIEVARLRKELEAAKFREDTKVSIQHECDHEATISKLRAFSEDQARQIQKLEERVGLMANGVDADGNTIAALTRELEKLKRGSR